MNLLAITSLSRAVKKERKEKRQTVSMNIDYIEVIKSFVWKERKKDHVSQY